MIKFKDIISMITGSAGALIASMIGEITPQMISLLIIMGIDIISGLISAGIFQNSAKTESGGLSSRTMLKGIFKKIGMLLLICVGYQIDITLNINYVKYAVVISLIIEEIISIIENLGCCGIPIPAAIKKGIDLLNKKVDELNDN